MRVVLAVLLLVVATPAMSKEKAGAPGTTSNTNAGNGGTNVDKTQATKRRFLPGKPEAPKKAN